VLELQSNTALHATVRLSKTGQKEYLRSLCKRALVIPANDVSTGRWIDASDDGIAFLELRFWRQCDERLTDPDFTDVSSHNGHDHQGFKGISSLREDQYSNILYERS
jgi:hypothetical protein